MSRAVMQQALEALEWNYNTDLDNIPACEQWAKMLNETIVALRAALAEPEQEPVRLQCTTCGTVYADGVPPQVPEQKAWFTIPEANEWAAKLPQPEHEVKNLADYEVKTYKIGGFHLDAGFYSAAELREMVKEFDAMDAAAKRSMRKTK